MPFDACTPTTPITPLDQVEQSTGITVLGRTRPVHSPQGDTLPEITLEGQHRDNKNLASDISVDTRIEETREETSENDLRSRQSCTVQESGQTTNTSFSYSPLQEVEESNSEDSGDDDLPNFDIGDILDL